MKKIYKYFLCELGPFLFKILQVKRYQKVAIIFVSFFVQILLGMKVAG
jgi:hypothetical protein